MKIKTIKISGFKPIPFCSIYHEPNGNDTSISITWDPCSFQVSFSETVPYLNAIIGPNSSGKSSVFHALDIFFGSKTKLDPEFFNEGKSDQRVIVEITFYGPISAVEGWHNENCIQVKDHLYEMTVANIWTTDKRTTYIYRSNGEYRKIGSTDKKLAANLYPEYRLISADSKMSDEANPEKNNLVADLIGDILEQQENLPDQSIVRKVRDAIRALNAMADRGRGLTTRCLERNRRLRRSPFKRDLPNDTREAHCEITNSEECSNDGANFSWGTYSDP